jgi:hypothetical protein
MDDNRYSKAGSDTLVGIPIRFPRFGGDPAVGEWLFIVLYLLSLMLY